MLTFKYQYPGDQVDICFVMDRTEFLQEFPREPITISTFGDGLASPPTSVASLPVDPDEIHCDLCYEDPGNEIYVFNKGTKGYCKKCAGISILPNKFAGTETEV